MARRRPGSGKGPHRRPVGHRASRLRHRRAAAPVGRDTRHCAALAAKFRRVVYNHPMARMLVRAAMIAFFPLSIGLAYQLPSTDGPISIIPVAKRATAELAPPASAIRVDSSLVLIPAHVTTSIGGPVVNLTKDGFRRFEDHLGQRI